MEFRSEEDFYYVIKALNKTELYGETNSRYSGSKWCGWRSYSPQPFANCPICPAFVPSFLPPQMHPTCCCSYYVAENAARNATSVAPKLDPPLNRPPPPVDAVVGNIFFLPPPLQHLNFSHHAIPSPLSSLGLNLDTPNFLLP